MREYILNIMIAAIFCAVASTLLSQKSAVGQIVKMLCGILLVVTAITPLVNISFRHITDYIEGLTIDANAYVSDGSLVMQEQINAIIKEETEAYILDKANQMGLQIAVEVVLDENNHSIPSYVTVTGTISPYTKEVLSGYIANTLGIAKENQKWTSKS